MQNLELVGRSNYIHSVEHVEARGGMFSESDKKREKEQFLEKFLPEAIMSFIGSTTKERASWKRRVPKNNR